MVNRDVSEIRAIMGSPECIRNVSLIAHGKHGKTTLFKLLFQKTGIIFDRCLEDCLPVCTKGKPDLRIRPIAASESLLYDTGDRKYLINLIDLPGYSDFVPEVSAALRVTDGALVIVDCGEGLCVHTETILRQALAERIKPILIVNKIDWILLELQFSPEEMYQRFSRLIAKTNAIISTYDNGVMGDIRLEPNKGNVAFGSGLMRWAFTLKQFAKIYAEKFDVGEEEMMERLWGENYFDPETKKWNKTGVSASGRPLDRGFCAYILEPIQKLASAIMEGNTEALTDMCTHLNILLKSEDLELTGRDLLKKVIQKWLNAADCLLEMITTHLPSPKEAGHYRTEILYEGPMDDACATAMRECDPAGPLMIYISKMVPICFFNQFLAFGRVFSGTISTRQQVRIMGPNYHQGLKDDLYITSIQRPVVMMGKNFEYIEDIPAGNFLGVEGINSYLKRSGTITDCSTTNIIRTTLHSISSVITVTVQPKEATDLPRLVEGLRRLSKIDKLFKCAYTEDGQHIISGCSELNVEMSLHALKTEFAKIEIVKSDPVVIYKEIVTAHSSQVCLAMSPNKHNRLYCTAQPLSEDLVVDIEASLIAPRVTRPEFNSRLAMDYQWDANEAKKVWDYGPEYIGPNMLLNLTNGVQYVQEIRDSAHSAFQRMTHEGVLCRSCLRGVRMNLMDVVLHGDAIHRGGGQIIPTARRAFQAAQISARPALQEPVLLVEIQTPQDCIGEVHQCLNMHSAIVQMEEQVAGSPLILVKALLPVAESFGFNAALSTMTLGKAFSQCAFDHWETLRGDYTDPSSKLAAVVKRIRVLKGMSEEVPRLQDLVDNL